MLFQFLLQADDEKHYYITDCPTGCANVNFDRNNDEIIETLVSDNPYFDVMNHVHKNLSESVNYEAMNVAGTPCVGGGCGNTGFNGPWNFDTDNEGFRTGRDADSKKGSNQGTTPQPTNWGEDSNWNGTLDVALNEDADGDNTLDQNWGIGGGCGWMTKGTGATGGVWHTGTIGNWAGTHRSTMCGGTTARENDSVCEQYDTELGSQGQNYWWESLRSPVVRPVRYDPTGSGGDGYGWKSRILDWAWNMQFDAADGEAHGTWEFDLDTADGRRSQLGDIYIHKNFGWESGLITGGQLDLYGGGYAFTGTDARPVRGHQPA